MQTIELKSLVKQGLVKNLSCLRQNVNGYLFVTLLSKGATSQNVYFGKNFSEELRKEYGIEETEITDEDNINVLQDLVNSVIVQTENAEGEIRYKIGRSIKYQSTSALAAAFGLELDEEVQDFDIEDFMVGFVGKQEEQQLELPKSKRGKLVKAA